MACSQITYLFPDQKLTIAFVLNLTSTLKPIKFYLNNSNIYFNFQPLTSSLQLPTSKLFAGEKHFFNALPAKRMLFCTTVAQ